MNRSLQKRTQSQSRKLFVQLKVPTLGVTLNSLIHTHLSYEHKLWPCFYSQFTVIFFHLFTKDDIQPQALKEFFAGLLLP